MKFAKHANRRSGDVTLTQPQPYAIQIPRQQLVDAFYWMVRDTFGDLAQVIRKRAVSPAWFDPLPRRTLQSTVKRSELRTVAKRTIEIVAGRERRHRWGIADKVRIVAGNEESGARICYIAARYDVCPSLLHKRRRLVREGRLSSDGTTDFVPVRLASSIGDGAPSEPAPPSTTDHGPIEVVLPSCGKVSIRRDTLVAMLR